MTELDERQLSQAIAARTHSHGELPPWGVDDLPEPLPFTTRNALRVIGPGAILLAA